MAEQSAISWTDATFNPWSLRDERITPKVGLMREIVAPFAQGDPVPDIKSKLRKFCKRANVVSIQIAASVVAAMATSELIPEEDVISPALQFGRQAQSTSLDSTAINIPRCPLTLGSILSRLCADLGASFRRVLAADPVARTGFGSRAHFRAAFLRHPASFCDHFGDL